jgi:putrescine---pyruvate transaminase
MTSFWHGFASMGDLETGGELSLVRGEGAYVWDDAGRRYLDSTGGLWFCQVGHGRAEIAEAVARQMTTLEAFQTFGDLTSPATSALAERVAGLAPFPDAKVFLTSGGSDSIDTATKLARRYWSLIGEPQRTVLVRRERAYHGMHTAGTSLAGIPANAEGFGELLDDVLEVPWDDADSFRQAIEDVGPDRVAAFFCEPVIGAGGVYPPPEGYLQAARDVCRDTGVLFVADEVITGFGRCGSWFASSRFGLEPDLVTCAKGITSGYLPLGAVLASRRVWEPFWGPGAPMFRHGYTYSGHATVCAAALANLDLIEREGLLDRAKALETELVEALAPLAASDLVSEVRGGTGALAAVQLDPAVLAADPTLATRAVPAARRQGIMSRMLASGALQISPPLVLDAEGVRALAGGLEAVVQDLEAAG